MLRSLPISAEPSRYICLSIMPTASRELRHQFFPSKKPGPVDCKQGPAASLVLRSDRSIQKGKKTLDDCTSD